MYPTLTQFDNEELTQRAIYSLHSRGVRGVERIAVKVTGGVVIVSGQLPSPDAKRLCLECCRRVAGVIRIVDQLHVPLAATEDSLGSGSTSAIAGG
ncbi:MAG: BON domain-containing protein [Planctomycetes bacterium]|nr:BON domain-containing protein [Planctomycetota bacterium]MBL7037855.1 BON domain-containing protein [Pirellulaceae bacterium]